MGRNLLSHQSLPSLLLTVVTLFILLSPLSSPTRLLFIQLMQSLLPVLNFKLLLEYFFFTENSAFNLVTL